MAWHGMDKECRIAAALGDTSALVGPRRTETHGGLVCLFAEVWCLRLYGGLVRLFRQGVPFSELQHTCAALADAVRHTVDGALNHAALAAPNQLECSLRRTAVVRRLFSGR